MNYTKEDIEYYLINREYHELSADELGFISSEVKSEKEFNQLKKLMTSLIEDKKTEEIIEPDPSIKIALMKEFNNKSKINKIWYNTLLIQLFPKEKRFYQMPGIQIAGVAASLLLVLNVFLTNDPTYKENQVAKNIELINEEENPSTELQKEFTGNSDSVIDSENLINEENVVESNVANTIVPTERSDERETPDINFDLEDEVAEDLLIEEDWAGDAFELTMSDVDLGSNVDDLAEVVIIEEELEMINESEPIEETNESMTLSGFTDATITDNESINNMAVKDVKVSAEMKSTDSNRRIKGKNNSNNSRSLKEDEELIDLFFTAL